MMNSKAYIQLARPQHWIKNVVVFLPILFSLHFRDPHAYLYAAVMAIAFCLCSSFAYIINDIRDRETDRMHARKKNRPIAAGRVSLSAAVWEALILLAAGLAMGTYLGWIAAFLLAIYVLLQLAYSYFFKYKAIIDVIFIALGFVLRTAGGAIAIGVEVSPWLFICMFTLTLFMGFCKRYNEIVTFGDLDQAVEHRRTLAAYSPELTTHLITLSAAVALIAFLLYTLSDATIERVGNRYLVYTMPVMVYGVFRFTMLSMRADYADPTDIFLHDRPFQITVVFWLLCALLIFLSGNQIETWLMQIQN